MNPELKDAIDIARIRLDEGQPLQTRYVKILLEALAIPTEGHQVSVSVFCAVLKAVTQAYGSRLLTKDIQVESDRLMHALTLYERAFRLLPPAPANPDEDSQYADNDE